MGSIEKPSRVNRARCKEIDGACVKCGTIFELEPHHIIHVSQGGKDYLWNLITLCHDCHRTLQGGYWEDGKFYPEWYLIISLLVSYSGTEDFRWQKALDWWIVRYEKEWTVASKSGI